jgi:hypothetical protein
VLDIGFLIGSWAKVWPLCGRCGDPAISTDGSREPEKSPRIGRMLGEIQQYLPTSTCSRIISKVSKEVDIHQYSTCLTDGTAPK